MRGLWTVIIPPRENHVFPFSGEAGLAGLTKSKLGPEHPASCMVIQLVFRISLQALGSQSNNLGSTHIYTTVARSKLDLPLPKIDGVGVPLRG